MHRFFMFALLLFVGFGCTEPIDIEKWDEVDVDATYVFTLIYLDLETSNFLDDSNTEINFVSDKLEIPISDDVEPYIEKIEFTVITENTFNREFELNFTLYDENDVSIYTINPSLLITANTGEQVHLLVIPPEDIQIIYEMTYIGAEINMLPNSDGLFLNTTDEFEFELKSSMKIFVNY